MHLIIGILVHLNAKLMLLLLWVSENDLQVFYGISLLNCTGSRFPYVLDHNLLNGQPVRLNCPQKKQSMEE